MSNQYSVIKKGSTYLAYTHKHGFWAEGKSKNEAIENLHLQIDKAIFYRSEIAKKNHDLPKNNRLDNPSKLFTIKRFFSAAIVSIYMAVLFVSSLSISSCSYPPASPTAIPTFFVRDEYITQTVTITPTVSYTKTPINTPTTTIFPTTTNTITPAPLEIKIDSNPYFLDLGRSDNSFQVESESGKRVYIILPSEWILEPHNEIAGVDLMNNNIGFCSPQSPDQNLCIFSIFGPIRYDGIVEIDIQITNPPKQNNDSNSPSNGTSGGGVPGGGTPGGGTPGA